MEKVTLTQLTSLIGKLTLTYQAVSPAPFHYRELQMYHIKVSQEGQPFKTEVRMTKECWRDMNWWLNNWKFNKEKNYSDSFIKPYNSVKCSKDWGLDGQLGMSCNKAMERQRTESLHKCTRVEGLKITGEYLPTAMNRDKDCGSCHIQNDWKLKQLIFKKIYSIFGQSSLDMFASSLKTQMAI